MPSVRLSLDRKGYRPGDMVVATIEVANENPSYSSARRTPRASVADAVLMEDLSVEVRGIEKLDPQWLVTPKPTSGSNQRRGEDLFFYLSACPRPATLVCVCVCVSLSFSLQCQIWGKSLSKQSLRDDLLCSLTSDSIATGEMEVSNSRISVPELQCFGFFFPLLSLHVGDNAATMWAFSSLLLFLLLHEIPF
jgi:hypothetical protein